MEYCIHQKITVNNSPSNEKLVDAGLEMKIREEFNGLADAHVWRMTYKSNFP